jgi:hypothetical protein
LFSMLVYALKTIVIRNKLKKHSVTKNCSDLSLFKSFSRSLEQFFLTVGQNNFGNKIPFFHF